MDILTPLVCLPPTWDFARRNEEEDLQAKQLSVGVLFMDWTGDWLKLWWAIYRTWEKMYPKLSHLELEMKVAKNLFEAGFSANKDLKWSPKTVYIEYDPFRDVVNFDLVPAHTLDLIQHWFQGEEYALDPRQGTSEDPRVRKGLMNPRLIDMTTSDPDPVEKDEKEMQEMAHLQEMVQVMESESDVYHEAMVQKAGESEIEKTW